ncbi:MAG TPA: hypothetical protein VGN41_09810 [Streptosporangiaceae bacterium]
MTVIAAAASTNNVTPGVLGFLIVAGMGVALFFLLKSMARQFKKLPPPPAPEETDGGQPAQPGQPDRVSPGPPRP